MSEHSNTLKRTLGPLMLWGLGVGYVISGMYFGWNLGLPQGGTLGLAIATFFITLMYLTFTFGYTELACAIPKAGGAFDYAHRALGRDWGFIGGMAQNIEFIFAPPAIAFAIGGYFQLFFPHEFTLLGMNMTAGELVLPIAIIAYFIFTGINIYGIEAAASFELLITVVAVIGLLIFAGTTLPEFEWANLQANALPNGYSGIFAAIPFAIWFYLAIEGVANVAEETINPQRNVLIGFGSAILTLVSLCFLTFCAAVGVAGWEAVVFPDGTPASGTSDSPLPMAMAQVLGETHFLYKLLIFIGLFGLVASFHGIILAAGRATFEFGRLGYAPRLLGKVHPHRQTPANALLFNMGIGIVALFTGKTGEIITIACFGALSLYIISMISLFALRRREPDLERPFRVPLYPVFPAVALVIASIALVAITVYNPLLALIYAGILGLSYGYFKLFVKE
ncbi:MAG: ethanolamine permease [Bacteroidetes bacterium]|nr:MAG: ethanolamine permease [Bacteroidota bacterium]